ncbi:hypothetical protein LTR37_004051 [Vermiconidia calcicola]|uniref:Uncharacterized protein n=1 Tax=Vermiconidia calcicola TaxID=1690605 RepID=A0ACC3NMU9_9PEZI|nr:hypothetical protein LTR37_004051 [Vermiconidia calcicola]
MADLIHRSYLRETSGPQAVDSGSGREKHHGSSRRTKEGDDRERHRSKRNESQRSPKKEPGHRRKVSNPQPANMSNVPAEKPSLELDVTGQPSKGIQLGVPVEKSVMLSLRLSASDQVINASNVDTERLFAVTSLVADTRSGDRVPLEPGVLSGQKILDSVHPIPEHCAATLARNHPCRLALGYFSFPGLLIRQAGTYRIRTTLVKTGGSADAGATSLLSVDSEPIKVERRSGGSLRRHQRVYS